MTASRRFPFPLAIALVAALPGTYLGAAAYLGLPHPELAPPLAALVYGIAIIGAAFVLSWAAEAAQVDISAGLALAVLALLAVLPEYAVDFVFSFQAGQIYAAEGTCPPAEDGSTTLRSRAGQHDRRQPGARRRRVAAGGGCRHARRPALAAPRRRRQRDDPPGLRPDAAGALGGGRLPRHRHAVLADAAAAAHAHARRRRGPGRDLLRLRVAAVEGARRGAGPAGHVGMGRRPGEDAAPGHVQPAVPRRRAGHPGLRGALRRGAGADRRGAWASTRSSSCSGWHRWPARRPS